MTPKETDSTVSDDEYYHLEDELYADPHAWRDYAWCLDPTPEEERLLFPWGKTEPTEEEIQGYIESHCYECPVIEQCFRFAMKTDSIGVWGGLNLTTPRVNRIKRLQSKNGSVSLEDARNEFKRG